MKRLLENRTALYIAVGVVAVGIATVLIVVSVVTNGGKKHSPVVATPVPTAAVPTSPTATVTATKAEPQKVSGAAATAKLFGGIPQKLNVLGRANAPVTLVEFADPQCPFCRQYALDALPALVDEYVRPGKVKLVFFGIAFIGPDSETGLRAAYAAGLQGRLWNFVDLLYKNQSAENSGWVTNGLLQGVGASISGFDVNAMMAALSGAEVETALSASAAQAQNAKVTQTPTFFAGKTGGRLDHMNPTSLKADAFRPTLDALLK